MFEILIVLLIVGLMLGLVVSRGPLHSQRLDLDAAARQMTASLHLARSRAIAQDRVVTVTVGARGFGLDGAAPFGWPAGVVAVQPNAIGFAPDGSSSGGTIVLQGGARRVAVMVDWLTGRVQLAESP